MSEKDITGIEQLRMLIAEIDSNDNLYYQGIIEALQNIENDHSAGNLTALEAKQKYLDLYFALGELSMRIDQVTGDE